MVCFWVVTFDAPAIVRHHSSIPSSLISSFHFLDVLVEALTLIVANIASQQETGRYFDTHVSSQTLICIQHVLYNFFKVGGYPITKEVMYNSNETHHASASNRLIENMKFSSCYSFRISGPSKTPALSFSIVCPGNDRQMYLKHSPYLSRAFTNCLISPNFICRGGSIILSLGIRGSFIMFLSHALSVIRGSQSFSIQWLALSRLSHIQKKHGCFVYTDCCPSRKFTIFRSTQIFQLCWLYFTHSRTCFTDS